MEKSIIIKNNIEEITQLSAFIESIAQELELSGELVFMLNLAIEEAVANIIQYAYPQLPPKKLTSHSPLRRDPLADWVFS